MKLSSAPSQGRLEAEAEAQAAIDKQDKVLCHDHRLP
jgi:hypothetical protein